MSLVGAMLCDNIVPPAPGSKSWWMSLVYRISPVAMFFTKNESGCLRKAFEAPS